MKKNETALQNAAGPMIWAGRVADLTSHSDPQSTDYIAFHDIPLKLRVGCATTRTLYILDTFSSRFLLSSVKFVGHKSFIQLYKTLDEKKRERPQKTNKSYDEVWRCEFFFMNPVNEYFQLLTWYQKLFHGPGDERFSSCTADHWKYKFCFTDR